MQFDRFLGELLSCSNLIQLVVDVAANLTQRDGMALIRVTGFHDCCRSLLTRCCLGGELRENREFTRIEGTPCYYPAVG